MWRGGGGVGGEGGGRERICSINADSDDAVY